MINKLQGKCKKQERFQLQMMIIFTLLLLTPNFLVADKLSIKEGKYNGFNIILGSKFNPFLVKDPATLSKYKYIIIDSLSLDNMKVKETGNRKIDRSWKFKPKYVDKLIDIFNKQSTKVINSNDDYELIDDKKSNALLVKFYITEFLPEVIFIKHNGDNSRLRKLGVVKFRIIIRDSSDNSVISIMDGVTEVTNKRLINNTLPDHYLAWKTSFYKLQLYLLESLSELKDIN